MKKILLAVLALALALGFSMPVYALTQTTTIPVSITIVPAVTVSATSLSFGSVAQSAFNVTGNATITVNATNLLLYTVTLDAGLNLFGGDRRMMSGATSGGSYVLYKDAAFSTRWGDSGFADTCGGGCGSGVAVAGTGANQTLTVYGLLSGGAGSTPGGPYTDTVTVTVNY